MPQVSRTQRLKSEICKFIPKYAYKDGIRVSDERYKELMLCRFRPEYTQIEVREAIDYLWRLLFRIVHTPPAADPVT